jgi:hypothetical protein
VVFPGKLSVRMLDLVITCFFTHAEDGIIALAVRQEFEMICSVTTIIPCSTKPEPSVQFNIAGIVD